jgi:hypothetical protein
LGLTSPLVLVQPTFQGCLCTKSRCECLFALILATPCPPRQRTLHTPLQSSRSDRPDEFRTKVINIRLSPSRPYFLTCLQQSCSNSIPNCSARRLPIHLRARLKIRLIREHSEGDISPSKFRIQISSLWEFDKPALDMFRSTTQVSSPSRTDYIPR